MDESLLEPTWVDLLTRETGWGSMQYSTMESMIGINNRGYGGVVPQNNDHGGITLFTRPRLNLSYNNLSADRVLTPLMTESKATYQRYFRDLLDPEGVFERKRGVSPFLDPKQAFIPLLTNNLLSLSGWPDLQVGTYTSPQGVYREEYSQIDDSGFIWNSFDFTANFRNIQGDPISALFHNWLIYACRAYEGTLLPHDDSILENEKDYETAIWRLVVSPDWEYVHKIGRTIAFPTNVPFGSIFNYDHDRMRMNDLDQISIQFRGSGVMYNDPILFKVFNEVVAAFNPDMLRLKRGSNGLFQDPAGNKRLLRISKEDKAFLNYYGYPHIDEADGRLSWFIDREVYDALIQYRAGIRR